MFSVIDVETRGLFGKIFRIGFLHEGEYFTFNTGLEFVRKILEIDKLNIYAFNVEFDFGKIYNEVLESKDESLIKQFDIDFSKSLIINEKFHVVKIFGKDIYFRDIYPIVQSSLDEAAKSFELKTKKAELDVEDKEEYFKTVSAEDALLNEYLKADVYATFELVNIVMELSGLNEDEFLKCPTIASLSMRMYRKFFPADYNEIKKSELVKRNEEFVREAYFGGRVEIFRPIMEEGFHYDVNSLYPSVMEKYDYPTDRASRVRKDRTPEQLLTLLDLLMKGNYHFIVKAKIRVKECMIAPLPFRHANKLIFPTGVFIATVCSPEFIFALERGKIEIIEILDLIWWMEKEKVFAGFIEKYKKEKMENFGARRNFAKKVQNSLYGKTGMRRKRITYIEYDQAKYDEFEKKEILCAKVRTKIKDIIMYQKLFFADYIRPQFAAFVTSYARVELLKQLYAMEEKGNLVYYCDTDSIYSLKPFEPEIVSDNEYGKWKLEDEVKEAIFILPKLYAVIDLAGKEILKSKGLVADYQKTLVYADYLKYYEAMTRGRDYLLYDVNSGYVRREKIIQAMKKGKSLETRILLRKALRFRSIFHKRVYDLANNTSLPVNINDIYLQIEELQHEKAQRHEITAYARLSKDISRDFRKTIISLGGVNDKDYEYLPRWSKRKRGKGIDELVTELNSHGYYYNDANELFEELWTN